MVKVVSTNFYKLLEKGRKKRNKLASIERDLAKAKSTKFTSTIRFKKKPIITRIRKS